MILNDAAVCGMRLSVWRARFAFGLLSLIAVGIALLMGRSGVAASDSYKSGPDCDWSILSTANTHVYNAFHGIAPVSDDDVWAVGSSGDGNFGQLTLIEHWDGATWTVVDSPDPGQGANELEDAVAFASDDVWAVGYYNATSNNYRSLILHWDGTAWTQVASPSPASFQNDLYDIDGVAPDDVWAVGYSWNAGSQHTTLIEHWDGTAWTVVASPNINTFQHHLTSVNAVSSDDVWAVGQYETASGYWQTLVLHWDGAAWVVVVSPNVSSQHNYLSNVSAVSANDIWAVGFTCEGNCAGFGGEMPFSMHWDGTSWSIVPTPDLGEDYAYLEGVTARGPNDAWAVGVYVVDAEAKALAEHWDGTAWSHVDAPTPGVQTCCPVLVDAVSVPGGDLWVAGYYHFPGNPVLRTAVLRLPASCSPATVTPTAVAASATATSVAPSSTAMPTATRTGTVTNTPAAPSPSIAAPSASPTATASSTATSTPATTLTSTVAVPSATPTACVVVFSDVPEGSTFYTYVRCLACREVLGGYPDGTFRPGNNVTRGQLAKIVANAAGLPGEPAGQSFEDVPQGSTFWAYVELIAEQGYINGYACGGAGEPCGPGNLPYFRPGASATRGQIAKIVSDAAGFDDTPSSQTFEDVAPGHTFYVWVERLAARSIMSGYACGGAGEPCVLPANRSYFRPSAIATRGQTAKIISSTFFPGCAALK